MQGLALEGGFATPAVDAAHAFRVIMDTMARPGTVKTIRGAQPPAPLSVAIGVCILTLCDHETPVYLAKGYNAPSVKEWIAFHTGAPIVNASDCLFAVGSWDSLLPLEQYSLGTTEYPDRSTTVIAELPRLDTNGATLSGPGIKATAALSIPHVAIFQNNHRHYPLGLDFIFSNGDRLAALPRSTEIS